MNKQYEFVKVDKELNINAFITGVVSTRPHCHDELELILVKKGAILLTYNNNSYTLKKNDIAIVNCNDIHSIKSLEEFDNSNILYIIHISNNLLNKLHIDMTNKEFKCNSSICKKAELLQKIYQIRLLIINIFHELINKDIAYKISTYSLLTQILTVLLRCFTVKKINKDSDEVQKSKFKLKKIFDYIDNNYKEDISIKKLAEVGHLSSYYLSHLFKSYTGLTFTQYLNDLRVHKCLGDLLTSDKKIIDIQYEYGFNNYKSFNQAFKRAFGCTPKQYRNSKNSTENNKEGKDNRDNIIYNFKSNVGEYIEYKENIYIDSINSNF